VEYVNADFSTPMQEVARLLVTLDAERMFVLHVCSANGAKLLFWMLKRDTREC